MLDRVRWFFLLWRARRDPAKFVERAGWHVDPDEAGSQLISASRYVAAGEDIPRWLVG
jgi:hypothetical protein